MERTGSVQTRQGWFQKVIRVALKPFLTNRDDSNDPALTGLAHRADRRTLRNRRNP
jgi:hypothetical protein